MNKIIRIAVFIAGSLLFGFSANAAILCVSPLPADCISPQWGAVNPDSDDPSADSRTTRTENNVAATRLPAIDGSQVGSGAHIRLAQMRKPSSVSHTPKLLINDVRQFDRDTQILVRAIERATFDRTGRLKTGEEQIERAVQALREPSKDHQLNLYIKTPGKLADRESSILVAKVKAVNKVIREAGSNGYSGKKTTPNS